MLSKSEPATTTVTQRPQPKVHLEGFVCPKCDFKTTQRSQFLDHKRRKHRAAAAVAKGGKGRLGSGGRFVEPPFRKAGGGKKVVKKFPATQVSNSRYFCCYCGLEQVETKGLLDHIRVVHLKL